MRPLRKPLGAVAVVAALLAASAGAAVKTKHTSAGRALARSVLLHRADLGGGWSSAPPPKKVPEPTCPGFNPRMPGAVETGVAITPTYRRSSSGPFVSQTAYAYATPAEEATAWHKLATRGLLICVAKSLTESAAQGVRFTITGRHRLSLPKLPASAAGYRVTARASQTGQSVGVDLDVVMLGRGRTLSEISISSIKQPPSRGFELRLARAVARRM
jgi:hypothetical protein